MSAVRRDIARGAPFVYMIVMVTAFYSSSVILFLLIMMNCKIFMIMNTIMLPLYLVAKSLYGPHEEDIYGMDSWDQDQDQDHENQDQEVPMVG